MNEPTLTLTEHAVQVSSSLTESDELLAGSTPVVSVPSQPPMLLTTINICRLWQTGNIQDMFVLDE